jgi:hypothetical protein
MLSRIPSLLSWSRIPSRKRIGILLLSAIRLIGSGPLPKDSARAVIAMMAYLVFRESILQKYYFSQINAIKQTLAADAEVNLH